MSGTKVSVDDLSKAIGQQLDVYRSNTAARIYRLTKSSMRKLVNRIKLYHKGRQAKA